MDALDTIVSVALDITAGLSAEERYQRLLGALRRAIPYDASALLRLEGDALVPVVASGLSADALGRRFRLRDHPRLEIICRSEGPIRFPVDSELPDPFDGLLADDRGEFQRIHACLGCPLRVGDQLIGALTADAASPTAFDDIEPRVLAALGALAAAEMSTTNLIEALETTAERQGLIARDLMHDETLRRSTQLLGTSEGMQRLRRDIDLVARSELTVMITGETGVGKEIVARAIHAASERASEPMSYVNCAALPESLADSELFGHLRGAFTGATTDRPGKFEVANGRTLFLDEIGELPLSVQPKLLRALQDGEIQRVGSDRTTRADVRVIAATNRDLEAEVAAGRFRADLFHRLNVYPLRVPPLRERTDDIPLLAGHFCQVIRRRLGLGPVRIDPEAMAALRRHLWPGNVRELENLLSRITLNAAGEVTRGEPVILGLRHLGVDFAGNGQPAATPVSAPAPRIGDLGEATREFQRQMIRRALKGSNNNWAAAGRALGMHRSNLHHLAVRLGLK